MSRGTEVILYMSGVFLLLFLVCAVAAGILSFFVLDKETSAGKRIGFIVGGAAIIAVVLVILVWIRAGGVSAFI
ncbi:MAG TPA: hypothetical protein PKO06_14870 [Candidatus Ozemobacteraceae bacterium]|nr:hypothetical protein [Candidatus Ozemobacteraceae bacterium]